VVVELVETTIELFPTADVSTGSTTADSTTEEYHYLKIDFRDWRVDNIFKALKNGI